MAVKSSDRTVPAQNSDPTAGTVAFVFNQRFYRVGDRHYAMTPNVLDLMQAFRQHAGRVIVCAPTGRAAAPPPDSEPVPDDLEVLELPYYASNLDLVLRAPLLAPALIRTVLRASPEWDAVGGDAPSGFGLATVILGLLRGKRGFLYVRGHLMNMFRAEYPTLTIKGALIIGAFWPLDVVSRLLTQAGVITFAMGPALVERHRGPRVQQVRGYARPAVVGKIPSSPVSEPDSLRRLVYVGRLAPEKGIDILLRALEILTRSGQDLSLTIVGDGPERAPLQSLVTQLGLDSRVTFTGNIVDTARLRDLYLSGGTVVVPSRTEGVPVAMLEAMSLGRIVIATRVGGIPSVLENGRNGLLVDSEDPAGLADAVQMLLHDESLAYRLAQAGWTTGNSLSIDAQAAQMMAAVLKRDPEAPAPAA